MREKEATMVARVSTPASADQRVALPSLLSRLTPQVAVRPAVARFVIVVFLVSLALMHATYLVATL